MIEDGIVFVYRRAAVTALREYNPEKIIVAVPTAPEETGAEFDDLVDEIICAETPSLFLGVGGSYRDFSQTTDQEVRTLLEKAD